jgi:hypothetical protein
MSERVTISYRGAAYELGRRNHSYSVWAVGAPRTEPVDQWPDTPDGWNAAWTRFVAMETPGTITAARSGTGLGISGVSGVSGIGGISASAGLATALLAIGVLSGVIGLFPGYLSGASLASQSVQLVPHAIYLGAWTLSAVLILLGGARRRAGALLAAGVSVVTLGFFLTDVGSVIAYGGHLADAGLWFSVVGWFACAAGSVAALFVKSEPAGAPATGRGPWSIGAPGRPRGYEVARAALLILAGIGAAVAFAPSWDSYVLHFATSASQTLTAGNAFSNPGPMIAGNLVVMIAFGLVVIAAALWRPLRLGAMLLAGAVIPMVAQAISALIQVGQATPPSTFGITPSQATQAGLTISNGLTAAFWIYCVLVAVLVVSCAWMLMTPPAPAVVAAPVAEPGTQPAGWAPVTEPTAWDDADDDLADWETDDRHDADIGHDAPGSHDSHDAPGSHDAHVRPDSHAAADEVDLP